MTIQISDMRFELRKALQRSIGEVLDEVLNLPHRVNIKYWNRDDLLRAISRSQAAISAARLLASEFSELEELGQIDRWSQDAIEYATKICDQLEEEVIYVQFELLAYAQ
jgi:hypothetical protein